MAGYLKDYSPPKTYQFNIDHFDLLLSFIDEITSVGKVVGITHDHITVEVEEQDRYDLGFLVSQLQRELTAIVCESVSISKPKEIL